jgi:hypothetical protein
MIDKKAAFDALAKEHEISLGVRYSIGPMFGPWTLCSLYRRRSDPATKGNGAVALRELASLADELRCTLTLGTSRMMLIPYFEQFGFVVTQISGPEDYRVALMKRPLKRRK